MTRGDRAWEFVVAAAAWPIAIVALCLIALVTVRALLRRRSS